MSGDFGKTRWKYFVPILLSGLAATSLLAVGMAQQVMAASFLISNQKSKLSSDFLIAHGVAQYGLVDVTWDGAHIPVAVASFRHAVFRNLCQSLVLPLGPLGRYTLKITAGRGAYPATAENISTDALSSKTDRTTYHGFDGGIAAGAITKGMVNPGDAHSPYFDPGSSAQQADTLIQKNVRTIAVATSAETFDLPGMALTLKRNGPECF